MIKQKKNKKQKKYIIKIDKLVKPMNQVSRASTSNQ